MSCSKCGSKPKSQDEALPEFVTKVTDAGIQVIVAARSDCVIDTPTHSFRLLSGATVPLYQVQAATLIESGAPIWVLP